MFRYMVLVEIEFLAKCLSVSVRANFYVSKKGESAWYSLYQYWVQGAPLGNEFSLS